MKDYKAKQLIYYKLSQVDDNLNNIEHIVFPDMMGEEIIDYCKRYFIMQVETVFPAKSYAVAIIYAYLLNKYFSESILEALDDKDLFVGTDKFFKPYNQNSVVYDIILKFIEENHLTSFEDSSIYQVKKTVDYFHKEFLWSE